MSFNRTESEKDALKNLLARQKKQKETKAKAEKLYQDYLHFQKDFNSAKQRQDTYQHLKNAAGEKQGPLSSAEGDVLSAKYGMVESLNAFAILIYQRENKIDYYVDSDAINEFIIRSIKDKNEVFFKMLLDELLVHRSNVGISPVNYLIKMAKNELTGEQCGDLYNWLKKEILQKSPWDFFKKCLVKSSHIAEVLNITEYVKSPNFELPESSADLNEKKQYISGLNANTSMASSKNKICTDLNNNMKNLLLNLWHTTKKNRDQKKLFHSNPQRFQAIDKVIESMKKNKYQNSYQVTVALLNALITAHNAIAESVNKSFFDAESKTANEIFTFLEQNRKIFSEIGIGFTMSEKNKKRKIPLLSVVEKQDIYMNTMLNANKEILKEEHKAGLHKRI